MKILYLEKVYKFVIDYFSIRHVVFVSIMKNNTIKIQKLDFWKNNLKIQ